MEKKRIMGVFKRLTALGLAGGLLWCGGTLGSVNAATLKDLFDEHYYADKYKDLKEAYGYDREALWNHYVQHGLAESRHMNELFDVKKYREQYADLNAAFGDDWDAYINHYLTFGAKEGRDNGTGNEFNAFDYAARYTDVQAAYGDDVLALWNHYQTAGAKEGREARSEEVLEAEREAEAEAEREAAEKAEEDAAQKPEETQKPEATQKPEETQKPEATQKPSAPSETDQNVNGMTEDELRDTIENYYILLGMYYQGNIEFMEEYMRPENKNTFNINGEDMSAETAKEHKITLDLENGDTIDGITSKNGFFDIYKLWGAHQNTEMDDTSIVITFKDDEYYDYFGDELNSFKGTEIKIWLKFDLALDTMVPYKAVVEFSVD